MTPPVTTGLAAEQLDAIRFSEHATARFGHRMRPALEPTALETELRRLAGDFGHMTLDPPAWVSERSLQEADAYLVVGDDLVLPLMEEGGRRGRSYVAVTALVRGCISDLARERRNARRRTRRR